MDSNHRFLIAQVFRRNNFRGKRIGQDSNLLFGTQEAAPDAPSVLPACSHHAADPVSLFRWPFFTKKRVRFHFVNQSVFERLVNLGRHKKISPLSVCNMSHLFGKVLLLLCPLFANPHFV